MPERGGLTITVPGAVRLWEDAAASLGTLPLARLLEPAWELAENGYPVSEVFARYWEVGEDLLLKNEAASRALLLDGRAPRPGEIFQQPDLAETISAVAEGGADAFYNGEIARSIARAAQEAGGYLSEEDLAEHESTWVEPISTDYRGVRVYEIPPPGQGVAALEMLNILDGRSGPGWRGPHPPRGRGEEAGLPRSVRGDRRSGVLAPRGNPNRASDLQRVCSEAARAHLA